MNAVAIPSNNPFASQLPARESQNAVAEAGQQREIAEVQAAMVSVFAAAKTAGKPVGILSPVEADARRYMEMGATYVAVGSDLGVLRMGTQALLDKYRESPAAPIAAQY